MQALYDVYIVAPSENTQYKLENTSRGEGSFFILLRDDFDRLDFILEN